MAAGPKRERGGADFGGPRRHRSSERRRPARPTSVASSRPPCRAGRTCRGGRRQAGATAGPPARRRRGAPSPVSAMAAAEEVGALDPAGSRPCRRPRRTSLPCAGPRAAAGGRAARVPLLPPYLDARAGAERRPRRLPAPAIQLPGGHPHQRGLPRAPPAVGRGHGDAAAEPRVAAGSCGGRGGGAARTPPAARRRSSPGHQHAARRGPAPCAGVPAWSSSVQRVHHACGAGAAGCHGEAAMARRSPRRRRPHARRSRGGGGEQGPRASIVVSR